MGNLTSVKTEIKLKPIMSGVGTGIRFLGYLGLDQRGGLHFKGGFQ